METKFKFKLEVLPKEIKFGNLSITSPFSVYFDSKLEDILTKIGPYEQFKKDFYNSEEFKKYKVKLKNKTYAYEAAVLSRIAPYYFLGQSPKKVINLLKGAVYLTFIKPYPKQIQSLLFKKSLYSKFLWNSLQSTQTKINVNQAVADNNINLVPFIIHFKASPEELKKFFGKGLWKKIHKNSLTKNNTLCKILVQGVERGGVPFANDLLYQNDQLKKIKIINFLREFTNIPLIVLNYFTNFRVIDKPLDLILFGAKYITKYYKGKYKSNQIESTLNTLWDELRYTPNKDRLLKLPPEELVRFHLISILANNKLTISKNRHYELVRNLIDFNYNGIEVKLIRNTEEISLEGIKMHHCVKSYDDLCANNHYIVASLSKDSLASTLGIQVALVLNDEETKIEAVRTGIHQHCSYCNQKAPFSEEDTNNIVNLIHRQLNDYILSKAANRLLSETTELCV